MLRKSEGFSGQKMIVLPQKIVANIQEDPLLKTLYITHIGYFPKANSHYRERNECIYQYILIHCIEGKGWYEIHNKRYEVNPNNYFILPAGIPHRYSADSEFPWSIYWIHFAGSLAKEFTNSFRSSKIMIHSSISNSMSFLHIFEDIYKTLEKGYSINNLGYANTSLWQLLGSLCFSGAYKHPNTEEKKEPIKTSINFMKKHLDKNLTLSELAINARYSISYYSNLFKKSTGYSPIDYFIHLKIQKSCQYLDLTNLNVNEISQKLGYKDTHYFSRLFRNIMGYSPTEYRKKQKG